jgi:hypothetical protein
MLALAFIGSVSADTAYTSTLEFNNAIADYSGNNYLSGAQVKLILKSDNTVNATATLNSTAGYNWTTGIGNDTKYYLVFYWNSILVYNGSDASGFDFTTNETDGASNVLTLTQQNVSRLALTDNSNLWVYLDNDTDVTFKSVSYDTQTKELVVSTAASSGNVSIIKVYHGSDLTMPAKVLAGGQDITAYKVANESELGNYAKCWYYDSANRVVEIKGTHASDLTYEVQFTSSSVWDIPNWSITIFNTTVPTLLLAVLVITIIVLAGGAYLLLVSKK